MSNRFGIDLPAATGVDPVAAARAAETLGYDFVSTSDHPSGTAPSNETWTMLTWIAAHTGRVGVMPRVLGVPYRNPAMVAKMAETLDRLAGGRLILGLGGGASDEEFRAFGIPVPPPRDKVDGLADAIRIIRGLWVEPAFTYTGRIHHVVEAPLEPKPARRIPIWVGTFGPRALDVTGRLADGWMPSLGYAPLDRLPGMLARVGAAAEAAGRSPSDITYALNVEVSVGADRPGAVSGPADLVAERLRALLAMGFTVLNLKPAGADRQAQVERLALEVLPAVRS
ncbi:LLM class flavin-dependent oxidoreductase [Dactylosporangium aurantiacum]|uniref:LLM class flavin-dependent oxidoreductase n=1 Tax=Dactylosporangium aurantiacum TaxID=35754 RepID=A0A9Q9I6M1_9ACTN|nr:LLM class flavin-dependent oxidoreductase [Dactylosporangium aurantiacum]MDG6107042.1 LLM class flavin-dependent oxidoreductase [Dactylosporangium aurantiacum]UWZ50609.1 LLM class flavin-dependent oxidoreductase [Dactylosporangium aurantiacum]